MKGKPFKKALRAKAVGSLASGPPLTVGETIGEFFTLPMYVVDTSAHLDYTDKTKTADDAAA